VISHTNGRRHGPDLSIRDKDLITGRDARKLIEEQWEKLAPVIQQAIDDAIAAECERVWYRRFLRWVRS
jgi:hypothetical protein